MSNENVNLPSNSMDMSVPNETNHPVNITDTTSDSEENMASVLSSSPPMEQECSQKDRKRNLNEVQDPMMKQNDQEKVPLDYENMSDDEIKQRLFKMMKNDVLLRNKLNQWLERDRTLFQFIRQRASLSATYASFKVEVELYQSYINMTQSVLDWLSGMSEMLIVRSNINDQFFKIQLYINKQLKNSEEPFKSIQEKLAQSIQSQEQMATSSEIDIRLITSFIVMFVRQDQQQFHVAFRKKRYLLMLNAKDVRLVHEFYDLQPNSRQLYIAERIWQATVDQHRIQTDTEYNQENRFQLPHYEQIIEDQKKLFLTSNQEEEGKDSLPISYWKLNIDLLMNIIESRQKILRLRLEFDDDFHKTFLIDGDNDIDGGDNNKHVRHEDDDHA